MSDWSELKRLAERAIPDAEWFKANNLACHANVDNSAAAFIAAASPAAIRALFAELDQLNERCQRLAARCNSLQAALNEALEPR